MTGHKIAILLIQYPGTMADFMCWYTHFPYTHATIGLSEDLNTFYSFVRKGFLTEKITRYLKPDRDPFPCALYEISVPEHVYQRIKSLLHSYEKMKAQLHYTHISLVGCFLRIPLRLKNRYFCSQFVAEVLQRGNAAKLRKHSALCLPKDFHDLKESRMVFQGNLQQMAEHYRLSESN